MNAQVDDQNSPLWMRYEPQTFAEVAGNQDAVMRLISYAKKKEARYFLIHGPTGTGKTTLARVYSRSFMCEGTRPNGYEPCGSCSFCKSVSGSPGIAGEMGDHFALEIAAGRTGKGELAVEEFLDAIHHFLGPIIVNEADRFLKSKTMLLGLFEKTREYPVFLTTTDIGKFEAEFISRCARIETQAVADKDMAPYLRTVALKEGVSDPDEVVHRVLTILKSRKETGLVRNAMQELEVQIAMARRS